MLCMYVTMHRGLGNAYVNPAIDVFKITLRTMTLNCWNVYVLMEV